MNYFLLIHSSLEEAFVAVSENEKLMAVKKNNSPREHSAFVHEALQQLVDETGIALNRITAIGVTAGPGSYTGIRVALSAAKGLGYALKIPLVLCSTLKALAATAALDIADPEGRYVALIHARQAEYYAGVYTYLLKAVEEETLMEIDENTYRDVAGDRRYRFFGIGLQDFTELTKITPADVADKISEKVFAKIVSDDYVANRVTDVADAAPLYLKEVFIRKQKK